MILVDSWPVDLLVSGEVSLENEITEHPVEEGSDVTDNISPKSIQLTTEGLVSDTPIGEIAQDPTRNAQPTQSAQAIAAFLGTTAQVLPSAEAYERLETISRQGRIVTIEIPIATADGSPRRRVFSNMALATLTVPLGRETDGGMRFTAVWHQIRFSTNRRTTVRTAIPVGGGTGKSTKTKSLIELTQDGNVLWRHAIPPGENLRPGYGWSVVQQRTTNSQALNDLQGGDTLYRDASRAHTDSWVYTGKFGGAAFSGSNKASVALSPNELIWFYKDMGRDTNAARTFGPKISQSQPGGDNYSTFLRQNDQLPDGVSMDRYQGPADINKPSVPGPPPAYLRGY